jgi:hypothetical protein
MGNLLPILHYLRATARNVPKAEVQNIDNSTSCEENVAMQTDILVAQ